MVGGGRLNAGGFGFSFFRLLLGSFVQTLGESLANPLCMLLRKAFSPAFRFPPTAFSNAFTNLFDRSRRLF